MDNKIFLNDILKFNEKDFDNIRIRFCAKNDEPKYAIDDYKGNPDSVNEDWFLWKREKNLFKVGQIAICLVRIYDTDEWLLTSIKRITKSLNVYNAKGFEGEELKEYKKYFGKILIHYHKDMKGAICVKYKTVCNNLEIIDDNYLI